jgi:hypothetical protein
MRWQVPILTTLTVFVAASCDQQPVAPLASEVADQPAFSAEHVGYEQVNYYNDVWYYSCLGENAWERGRIRMHKGRVYQPSGNANRWTWDLEFYGLPLDDPDYVSDEFTLLGLTSGDLWTLDRSTKATGGRRHDKKDGFVYHQAINQWFTNQDGEKLHYQEVYTLHCDYDWNCSLEQSKGSCPTDWPH